MGLWAKSVVIFNAIREHGTQSIRSLADRIGLSKSSVHRHLQAIDRRDRYPESSFWETKAGRTWVIRLVVATLFVFGPIVSGSIFARWWSFQMQAVNMSDQFSFRGPSTEVEAQHLIGPLGRCLSDPQADQQARNTGGIHLEAYPVDPLTQQMPAAQHTFDPAEKQLHRPPIAIRHGQQLGIQVQPIRDQNHNVWRPILSRLVRGDLHHAERLRQQAGMVRRAQAAEDYITHNTRMHGGGCRACSSWTSYAALFFTRQRKLHGRSCSPETSHSHIAPIDT